MVCLAYCFWCVWPTWKAMRRSAAAAKLSASEHRIMSFTNCRRHTLNREPITIKYRLRIWKWQKRALYHYESVFINSISFSIGLGWNVCPERESLGIFLISIIQLNEEFILYKKVQSIYLLRQRAKRHSKHQRAKTRWNTPSHCSMLFASTAVPMEFYMFSQLAKGEWGRKWPSVSTLWMAIKLGYILE